MISTLNEKKVAKTQSTFPPRVAGKPLILATQVLKRAGKWRKNEPDEGHLARTRASDCLLCMLSEEEGRNEEKERKEEARKECKYVCGRKCLTVILLREIVKA